MKTAWVDYAERAGKLPPEPTVGSRMNVRLACFTMSFFNALLASGTEREYAIELVAACRHHDDRHGAVFASKRSRDVVAVNPG